ncbi:MAG: glycosyltransferase family 4 protein [Deltaproteobacteria bacterium]|nr:glycosyltransferase family 4 protein [Deltaproteobacteria bacterium]
MKVWIVEISDFLPKIDGDNRLYRAGMLAKALVEAGHEVLWWSSTFNHQLRKQRFDVSTTIDIEKNYSLRLLYGPGYRRSISFGRWRHNRAVAREFAWELSAKSIDELPDLIYACLPTLEVSEQAVLFGNRYGIPVIVDIRDRWPDIYLSPLPKVLHPIVRTMLKTEFARAHRIFSKATAITGVSTKNLEWGLRLARRKANPKDRWFPLGFSVDGNDKSGVFKSNPKEIMGKYDIGSDPFVVTFLGTFSAAFNLKTVIHVAQNLSEAGHSRIKFVMVGDGVQTSFLRKVLIGIKNIVLTGWLDKSSIDEILKVSSVGLAPYSSIGLITLPNKPFEYMAAGLPILSSLEGELKTIIEQQGIGLQYRASDPIDLKDKIIWFLSHPEETKAMGQRAKALFEEKYNADVVYPGLVEHLTKIASGRYQTNE